MNVWIDKIRGDPRIWSGGWRWRHDRLKWWAAGYGVAVVVLFASILVAGPLAFLVYLGLGWWLGRKAWRNVMWLECEGESDVTAHAEAWFILTWLWSHPVLIAACWVTRE